MFDETEFKKSFKTIQLIAAALPMGCALMAFVFWFLISQENGPSESMEPSIMLSMIVFLISLSALGASFFIKGKMLETKTSDPKVQLSKAMFVCMALVEGPLLLGFVLAFASGNAAGLILPAVVGTIGFILHFPKYAEWEHWIKN